MTHKIDLITQEIGAHAATPLPRDVSPREYFRVQKDEKSYILMLYPEASSDNITELNEFLRISSWLRAQGIKAPQEHIISQSGAYALIDDLGDVSFGRRLRENNDAQTKEMLYMLGCDVLRRLADASCPRDLPLYSNSRIHANRRQIVDYYISFLRKNKCSEKIAADYIAAWGEIESNLPPCPMGFVHGDFHLENLMYCANEAGIRQCALIDFQDALYGPLPYDLVNLLEDARVDVPEDLRKKMIGRYCEGMNAQDREAFLLWYRVLGTQFHGRVIGLFIKLAAEQGRDQYLIHINRLQNYISNALHDPILRPLRAWFEKESVDFSPIKDLNGDEIRAVFQNIQAQ